MLDDAELPRQTTLEDYVKYKPARRRKGESPKRSQPPAYVVSKDSSGIAAEKTATRMFQEPLKNSPSSRAINIGDPTSQPSGSIYGIPRVRIAILSTSSQY